MKKIIILLLVFITTFQVRADEGMWLPMLIQRLNYVDMQKHGLQLTAEEIYSVNNSSLKDAIVALGGGFCSGEIISNQGLMLTNHHCGYGEIQRNSSTDHDYLTDGFWAKTKADELPAEFSVWFLDRMDDVTKIVLADVTDEMTEEERSAAIRKAIKSLSDKEMEGKDEKFYKVQVKSFYYGNEYYMFKYNIFNDVRLVGAPPSSIGKFGGDTDNWMWPRHTGDFSMFRIYANANNEPADYSKDNKPYQPKHHLPVSIKGVENGDYAMIMGYPGSTDRYLTSFGVEEAVNIEQPNRVKIRRAKLDIMDKGMEKDQKVRIQYASKYAGISNYWKYFQGQSQQLVKNNVQQKKEKLESEYLTWANADATRKEKYGNALELIKNSYTANASYTLPSVYFEEAVFQGPEIFTFVLGNFAFRSDMQAAITANDATKIEEAKKEILENAPEYYKDYNAEIDQNLLAEMLSMFYNNVDAKFHPATLTAIAKKNKNDFNKFAADYMSKSPFTSEEKLKTYLAKFNIKTIKKDPIYTIMNELIDIYIKEIITPQRATNTDFNKGMRLFVDGLRQMKPNKVYASDANSTMRLTYGNVLPYNPQDAVTYHYLTTLEGVMAKEVKTENKNHEFYIPAKLKELYDKKDYGQYATKEGKLPVGFLSNNDITGGNSGSPVINAKGELIGTAFDGNWEAMSGDIYFEPDLQRTISVDIRYTLFIIDKYAGAKHLINEMTLIK
ncbi:MAG: serine protease [Bacteroidetes bacterium HGW-Bacteroidetes-12]|nr:MAG: serine protease [Bacteroidetes bacterium HGW-Bacteroidetes-12]